MLEAQRREGTSVAELEKTLLSPSPQPQVRWPHISPAKLTRLPAFCLTEPCMRPRLRATAGTGFAGVIQTAMYLACMWPG